MVSIDLATIISLVGALGVGSVVGQWFGGAKDRRAARLLWLRSLVPPRAHGGRRVKTSSTTLRSAVIGGLEIAALLARVPRPAVWVYSQLATAATWYIREDIQMDGFGPEYGTGGGLDMDFSDTVLDAADIVSRAAWSSPISRRLWLARRLRRLDRKIEASRTVPCPCGAG